MAAPMKVVGASDTEVASKLCDFVIERANKAITEGGKFTVGFSGTMVFR